VSEIEYDEWMSHSDAIIWYLERDPLLRSTVCSVWVLDEMPDRARVDAAVRRMAEGLERCRERVIDDPTGIATPRWETDPNFDLSYHYQWVSLPGDGTDRNELLDYAQHRAGAGFDKDRPLWTIHVVEGMSDGRSAVVITMHHAIADGFGMLNMLSYLVEFAPDDDLDKHDPGVAGLESTPEPESPQSQSATRSLTRRFLTDAEAGFRLGRASMKLATDFVRNPLGTTESTVRTTASIANLVKPAPKPLSPLMTGRSMSPVFNMLTVPVQSLRAAGKTADASINDAFVSGVLDGLDRYHRKHGAACDEVRMLMPISVRTVDNAAAANNQFVPMRVILPLATLEPADRLATTKERLSDVRGEPALPHLNDVSAMISRLGATVAVKLLGDMMKGLDVTTSNVPGLTVPLWLAGARIKDFFGFGPMTGSAVNVTLFSYDGTAFLGITTDPSAIPDTDAFIECIGAGIDAIVELADA